MRVPTSPAAHHGHLPMVLLEGERRQQRGGWLTRQGAQVQGAVSSVEGRLGGARPGGRLGRPIKYTRMQASLMIREPTSRPRPGGRRQLSGARASTSYPVQEALGS